jgi:hypothetical protein
MLDANAIAQQVRSGTAPPTWQVLRANTSFFIRGAIGGFVFMILAIAVAIFLFLSGTVIGIGVSGPNVSEGYLTFWFIVDMVVLALVAVGCIIFAISRIRGLGSIDEQVLVLMPEGFVRHLGPSQEQNTVVLYQNIATITLVKNSDDLQMQLPDGSQTKVELDSRFGDAKQLGQQIQGAHAQFVAAHQRLQ